MVTYRILFKNQCRFREIITKMFPLKLDELYLSVMPCFLRRISWIELSITNYYNAFIIVVNELSLKTFFFFNIIKIINNITFDCSS